MNKCKYGCGNPGIVITIKGEWLCNNSPNSCPKVKEKKALKGHWMQNPDRYRIYTERTLEKYGVTSFMKVPEILEKAISKRASNNPARGRDNRRIVSIAEKTNDKCVCTYGCGAAANWYNRKTKNYLCSFKYTDCPSYINWKSVIFFKKTGKSNPFQLEEVKEKSRQTMITRYGKANPLLCTDIKERIKETCMDRYGVENPSQSPEIQSKISKSSFRRKIYKLPSGRIIYLQGYEPKVLAEFLEKHNLREEDFEFDNSKHPIIWYTLKGSSKKHRYHMDFFIPRLNWVIEVKSTRTFLYNTDGIPDKETNLAKRKACLDLGYKFNFIIR